MAGVSAGDPGPLTKALNYASGLEQEAAGLKGRIRELEALVELYVREKAQAANDIRELEAEVEENRCAFEDAERDCKKAEAEVEYLKQALDIDPHVGLRTAIMQRDRLVEMLQTLSVSFGYGTAWNKRRDALLKEIRDG